MKDEQKYNLPWKIQQKIRIVDKDGIYISMTAAPHNEFIVTACNSYHTLKQQNEEMKEMLGEIRDSELFIAGEHFSPVAKQITDLLTKHKL